MWSDSSRGRDGTGLDGLSMHAKLSSYTQNKLLSLVNLMKEAPVQGTPRVSRDASTRVGWLQGLRQLLPEIALAVIAAYLWYRTGEFRQVPAGELGPDFWPQLLTALLGLTACIRGALKVIALRRAAHAAADPVPTDGGDSAESRGGDEGDDEPIFRGKAAIVMALSVGYVLGVIYLGYPLGSAIFLAVFLWLAGKRNWLVVVPVSVIGALLFAYVFQKIVFVALPTGVGIFDAFTVWLYQLLGIY